MTRPRRMSIEKLYKLYRDAFYKKSRGGTLSEDDVATLTQAAEHHAHLTRIRPQIVQLQGELQRDADELYYLILREQGVEHQEAALKVRGGRGIHWIVGEKKRIR